MSQGSELLTVLNQVRDFFEQASSLLATADAMMAKGNWRPLRGSLVTADNSTALPNPRLWMPHYLCRPYVHPDRLETLGSISIVLGMYERDPEEQKRLSEPLVCASMFEYKGEAKIDTWQYEFSTWHLYTPSRKDDGTVLSVDPRVEWPGEKCNASRMLTLAVPLLALSDAQSLKERITEPLLKLLLDN